MNLAGPDLIIIFLIILVLFGAKRLPDLAKGMGQAIKEFHKAKDEFTDEVKSSPAVKPEPAPRSVSRNVLADKADYPLETEAEAEVHERTPSRPV